MSGPLVLIVEDDAVQRKLIADNLEREGYAVVTAAARRDALDAVSRFPVEIAVVDYRLAGESGVEVIADLLRENPLITPIMATAYGSIETAVAAIKAGAYDFVVKPIDFAKFLLVLRRAGERHKLKREVEVLRTALGEKFSFRNFIFASSSMEEVARLMSRAAASDATVLVTGETGTGKELVARTIHQASRRQAGLFLAVNLPAIPEALLESELFGAEKGSYTGAHERKTGKFEAASGGTLFLDEIGDLPTALQVKILRFLQDREFTRLGSAKPFRSDVRIIAATNRDLEALVAREEFRTDLYYRLNVIRIHVPPLGERKEDIPSLVDHFISAAASREKKKIKGISTEAMNALMAHSFPGNIRELANALERAVVFADGEYVMLADLPVPFREREEKDASDAAGSLEEKVRRLEVREIRRALAESSGIKAQAARALGITERMLRYKIRIYGIRDGVPEGPVE